MSHRRVCLRRSPRRFRTPSEFLVSGIPSSHTNQSSPTRSRTVSLVVMALILAGNVFAATDTEKVIYPFLGPPDGATPQASLVADAAGNLYGTTFGGGVNFNAFGTVFELSPPAVTGGAWTETILHTFQADAYDGQFPTGTLILDKKGNLYGTTTYNDTNGGGTIFELSPPSVAGGSWTETVLWSFPKLSAGAHPSGKLVMDEAGNLYGTTASGGNSECNSGCGIVFELVAPKTVGLPWAERVLYVFNAFANDGRSPGADLLLRGGVLYGTTWVGGAYEGGTIFKLVRKPGLWTETILYNFTRGSDGFEPEGGLIFDSAGNLYGTTSDGGNLTECSAGCGTIYELSPPVTAGDPWVETTLHAFNNPSDGAYPSAFLWRDKSGSLYGTTYSHGKSDNGLGTVFKLKPPSVPGGDWTLVVLHYFRGVTVGDGAIPYGGLTLVKGVLYGTTSSGGKKYTQTRTSGTVFSVSP
jgi:uncharacterized repeat protein (TIGR03803 family)